MLKEKRSVKINFKDGSSQELVLSKATSVKTDAEFLHFDKMKDGTWRLIYNPNMIPDFTQVVNLEIIRDE